MRINLPVTSNEVRLATDELLVSTTDLKGRITYCNPAFIEASGFTRDELIGQPHNLIRHPDMPEEAFRDLWQTISAGQPWSAMVKNRRKDGDHYWVMANVTPLMDAGAPVGYMSVRTTPTREQVQEAEALYRRLREQQADGGSALALQGGQVVRGGRLARWLRACRPGPAQRHGMAAWGVGAVGWIAAWIGVAGSVAPSVAALMAGAAAMALASVLVAWRLRQVLLAPLDGLLDQANRIAAGDLTQSASSARGEVAVRLERALNQLTVNMRSIVRDARTEVQRMGGVAAQIASGNRELSSRTDAQAANLEQTASSMEQVTSTVARSADATAEAAALADGAAGVTRRSSEAVDRMRGTIQEISEASARIGDIVSIIDGIAFQTNLLALNAAVEAARAGPQGRGFAVVAAEVRTLARRSADAAREIAGLILASGNKVACGVKEADAARRAMDEALVAVGRVSVLITQVNTSASEQLTGIEQVNQAVTELDGITQRNAAMVGELAASARALHQQAGVVADSVSVFRVNRAEVVPADAVALRREARRRLAQPAD